MTDGRLLRWGVVLLIVLLGGLSASHLTINDDALDLLPDGAVRGDLQLLQQIGLVDRLFITLRAEELNAQESLRRSGAALGEALQESGEYTNILARLPAGYSGDLFSKILLSLPLLLDERDLQEIALRKSPEAIRDAMRENFLLLNSPAGMAMRERVQRDPLGFLNVFFKKLAHLQAEFQVRPNDGFLMSRDGKSLLILAESRLPLTDSKNSERLEAELHQMFATCLEPGITAEMIGTLPHTLANSRIIKRDLRYLLPAATALLTLLLACTLRDIRAVAVFAVPFLGALPAIGVSRWMFGEISALALGFGIVILGISVDFSVHLYLALTREEGGRKAIQREVAKPIVFACLTTVSVLLVLLLSDVSSHRQMAVLALAGVVFGVLFAWLLIPTVVGERGEPRGNPAPVLLRGNQRGGRWVLVFWLLLVAAGLCCWPQLRYNGDLRVLDAPDRSVTDAEERFATTWGDKGEQAFVIAVGKTPDNALQAAGELFTFLCENGYGEFQSPVVLLPDLETQEKRLDNWMTMQEQDRADFQRSFLALAEENGFSGQAFTQFLAGLDATPPFITKEHYDRSVFAPLIDTMLRPYGGDGGGGGWLVLTTVGVTEENLPPLLAWGHDHQAVTVLANWKWRSEVERLLKKDILLLSLLAAAVVVCLVSLQFRSVRAVVAVLAPVVSALSAMAVFCLVTTGELNMMHLIMGIMVIGLSVDYGIFIVCSYMGRVTASARYAVSVCAASSLIGFGVLSFAAHPALYSLGVTVLVGIGAAWPAALLVCPVILGRQESLCAG